MKEFLWHVTDLSVEYNRPLSQQDTLASSDVTVSPLLVTRCLKFPYDAEFTSSMFSNHTCPRSVIELPRNAAALFLSPYKIVKSTTKHLFQQEAITQHFFVEGYKQMYRSKEFGDIYWCQTASLHSRKKNNWRFWGRYNAVYYISCCCLGIKPAEFGVKRSIAKIPQTLVMILMSDFFFFFFFFLKMIWQKVMFVCVLMVQDLENQMHIAEQRRRTLLKDFHDT